MAISFFDTRLFARRHSAMKNANHPIRQYRRQNNLTMYQLADRIGVSASMVHHLEHNRGHTTVRRVLKFCQQNMISPLDFFPDE